MILSTCGAKAAGFQTTSLVCRAAWARRANHQGAVVVSAAAAAYRSRSRRVGISVSPPVPSQPVHSVLRVLSAILEVLEIAVNGGGALVDLPPCPQDA